MTRRFNHRVQCPKCFHVHTAETAFERWMRGCEALDSRLGIVRFDLDMVLHRYMTVKDQKGTRDVQCLMFVEIKRHPDRLTAAQQDTLSIFSQVMKNRCDNRHAKKRGLHAHGPSPPLRVWSRMNRKNITLRVFGVHLLEFSHDSPPISERIHWDRKEIDLRTLILLLRFELDPDSLKPMDWRRRSGPFARRARQIRYLF